MFTGFVRTVILYLVLIVGIRLMGKRQVGELEPSELVLSLVIADLAAVPMQDFGIPLLAGVIPILTLLALTMILSVLTMKHVGFRALLETNGQLSVLPKAQEKPPTLAQLGQNPTESGLPLVLISDGHVLEHNLTARGVDRNWLEKELGRQGCSDPSAVFLMTLDETGGVYLAPKQEE